MSESRRVRIDYASDADAGPASVVLKTASADETSRSTGVGLGVYDREVRFYRELAPRIGGPLPECHLAVDRRAAGLVHAAARGRRARRAGRPDRGLQRRRRASGDPRAREAPRARVRRPPARRHAVAEPGQRPQPGRARPAAAGRSSSATTGASATSTRRSAGGSSRASTAGPRTAARRWASCTATTASTTCCSAPRTPRGGSSWSTGRRSAGAR